MTGRCFHGKLLVQVQFLLLIPTTATAEQIEDCPLSRTGLVSTAVLHVLGLISGNPRGDGKLLHRIIKQISSDIHVAGVAGSDLQ